MSPNKLLDRSESLFVHLNVVRGVAALLVLVGHLRSFVFLPYNDLKERGPIDICVWAVTGFGHQAVMIFFVLSGFFITRSILEDDRRRGFSWSVYLIKRLTRIWIVLIPSLLLTLLWDKLGIFLSGIAFYSGLLYSTYSSGPDIATTGPANFELATFIGNVGLLQNIYVPIFGSNGPLWSLANEFWYYLMFPLLYLTITRQNNWRMGIANIMLFGAICVFVGQGIAIAGLVWLAGALIYVIYDRGWLALLGGPPALGVTTLVLLATLAAAKASFGTGIGSDLAIGFAAAAWVLVLARTKGAGGFYGAAGRHLADASYTIYLVHFPFLAVMTNVLLANQRFEATAFGYFIFAAFGATALIYSYMIYWCFERHSGEVRRYCLRQYSKSINLLGPLKRQA